MKIISYNIRGLRDKIKWKFIRKLVGKEEVQMLCFHETKKRRFIPAQRAIGGLLCLWDTKSFAISNSFVGEGHIGIGVPKDNECEVVVVNVYLPCGQREGKVSREREGVGENMHGRKESVGLDLELIGMPLVGRKFTWFRPNGMARSRIDKVLVSMDCLNGPKPFKFFDWWLNNKKFHKFIEESWWAMEVHGYGAFVLKEKINMLKNSMKVWNVNEFGCLEKRLREKFDEVDERRPLLDGATFNTISLKENNMLVVKFEKRRLRRPFGNVEVKRVQASLNNVLTIKTMLRCYELVLGLKVNVHKSFFGALRWIPTVHNLMRTKINVEDPRCPFCLIEAESCHHVLFSCTKSYPVWTLMYFWLNELTVLPCSPKMHFLQHFCSTKSSNGNKVRMVVWGAMIWNLWKVQNSCVFRGGSFGHGM
ncbi:hypothetical protein GmHk_15G044100 [Glycine max]|nr:hypothetical protein GmHk_15G044100 [Glycine max]